MCGREAPPVVDLMTLPPSAIEPRLLDRPDADLRALIDNLAGNVSFGMNSQAKRIVASAYMVVDPANLSPAQRNAIIRIGHRYRRQLSDRCRRIVGDERETTPC
jgi:hypothetical protein